TTYPSYALNLAQLGALCISNLCATKPLKSINAVFFLYCSVLYLTKALEFQQKTYLHISI
ncbi:hypothetical protein KTI59_09205, partial [Acinetobacter radioresistens]|uniref:hypothetical protein n=1 Tax=Acinetobacter radioresistens TaxID=40216 RepID=UPI0021CD27C0